MRLQCFVGDRFLEMTYQIGLIALVGGFQILVIMEGFSYVACGFLVGEILGRGNKYRENLKNEQFLLGTLLIAGAD